jgi:D-alanyl-D-alanine carboxypeptidase (penicillin-binding protein 5/6)
VFEQFLSILYLLSNDMQLPAMLHEPLVRWTEDFRPLADLEPLAVQRVPEVTPVEPPSKLKSGSVALKAKRGIILDADSAQVLYEKNSDEKAPLASITKLVTALVVLDQAPSLESTYTVPKEVKKLEVDSAVIGLLPGEKLTVRTLLEALIVHSANDAAVTLAVGAAGSESKFVDLMNKKAEELGLRDSHFANSHGLDATGNVSTARDVAFLVLAASKQPLLREFSQTNDTTITSKSGTTYYLKATNQLLKSDEYGVVLAKTGSTDFAGSCFAVLASVDGHRMVSVVLDSPDRFGETETLLRYGSQAFDWPASRTPQTSPTQDQYGG